MELIQKQRYIFIRKDLQGVYVHQAEQITIAVLVCLVLHLYSKVRPQTTLQIHIDNQPIVLQQKPMKSAVWHSSSLNKLCLSREVDKSISLSLCPSSLWRAKDLIILLVNWRVLRHTMLTFSGKLSASFFCQFVIGGFCVFQQCQELFSIVGVHFLVLLVLFSACWWESAVGRLQMLLVICQHWIHMTI